MKTQTIQQIDLTNLHKQLEDRLTELNNLQREESTKVELYRKELEKASSYDTMIDELNDNIRYSTYNPETSTLLNEVIDAVIKSINDILDGKTKGTLSEKEILVGQALINLLENWEDILFEDGSKKFNKSNILYLLRETTRLNTKEIRDSMRKYKKAYFIVKEKVIRNF
jgi:hypothetical protein